MKKALFTALKVVVLIVASLAIGNGMFSGLLRLLTGPQIEERVLDLSSGIGIGVGALLVYRALLKREGWKLGLHRDGAYPAFAGGMLAGILFIGLSVALVILLGGATIDGFHLNRPPVEWMILLAGSFCKAFGEEILFRGALQGLFRHAYGRWLGIGISAAIFFLLHGLNPGMFDSVLAPVNLLAAGVLLALLREKTGSLWLPIGFHWTWNLLQDMSGFAVSGRMLGSAITEISLVPGREWLNGGNFGLEGSIVPVALIALACVYLVNEFRKRPKAG